MRLVPLLSLILAIVVVAGPAGAASPPVLRGTVGPGFTITLKSATGKSVRTLKPGAHTFAIRDLSGIHDFHLRGPGVNKTTSVAGTGKAAWTLRLRPGRYSYVCDPHHAFMHGSFVVR